MEYVYFYMDNGWEKINFFFVKFLLRVYFQVGFGFYYNICMVGEFLVSIEEDLDLYLVEM